MQTTPKNLTQEPPRSPHVEIGGYKILGRTIDKCRALLWSDIGEYHFDCPLDNQLFSFKGLKGADFKAYVEKGHTDDEIAQWVTDNGTPRTADEIREWNAGVAANNYSGVPDKAVWLAGEAAKLNLPAGTTLFDWLDADDKASFPAHK